MRLTFLYLATSCVFTAAAFSSTTSDRSSRPTKVTTTTLHATNKSLLSCRKSFLSTVAQTASTAAAIAFVASADEARAEESMDVENFLKSGGVAMPMGVSGQAGKSRPENGVFLRDGTDVSRNIKSGDVLAEILLKARSEDPTAVLTSFSSPWPLGKNFHFY